jgi:hypothetical protein
MTKVIVMSPVITLSYAGCSRSRRPRWGASGTVQIPSEGAVTREHPPDARAFVVTTHPTYCTILSTNYLPKALALADSLRRHEDGASLKILFIDIGNDDGLPRLTGVECLSTASLGLPHRTLLHFAMAYDLVEFATAVKPLLLKALLEENDQVVYLDPDTYLTSPMIELSPALQAAAGGILLTPHFLRPPPPDAEITEGHMLLAGVFNLGFCAIDRRAHEFLDWWWGHLRHECLYDPLSGLFYDQKWMDIGSTLFEAGSFRHSGYNVGVANLPERPLALDADGYYISSNGERLRLFHFHAFDSSTPEKLSMRFRHSSENVLPSDSVVFGLCREYAAILSSFEQSLPASPPYPYATDTRGRLISRQLRRAYRVESQACGMSLPSPFEPSEAGEYEKWRHRAWQPIARGLLGDAAKCVRIVLPEEYERVKKRFPRFADKLNNRFSGGTGLWG